MPTLPIAIDSSVRSILFYKTITNPGEERDDAEAIDTDNILDERTRGAGPSEGYREPGDEEGLPSDTGRSAGGGYAPQRNAEANK